MKWHHMIAGAALLLLPFAGCGGSKEVEVEVTPPPRDNPQAQKADRAMQQLMERRRSGPGGTQQRQQQQRQQQQQNQQQQY